MGSIYVSGTLGTGGGDIKAQTRQVLDSINTTLKSAGSSLANAASVTVYLRNQSDFAAMNDVYRDYWTKDPPARTTVMLPLLNDGLVEISAVAVPDGGERVAVNPGGWLVAPNPYSYGIKSGNTLFLAGLISRNGKDNSPDQRRHHRADQDGHGQRRRGAEGRGHELRRCRQLTHLPYRHGGIPGHERGVPDLLSGRSAGARDGQGAVDFRGLHASRSRWLR